MWINSLNIDDLYVNYLFADIDDGALLLKLIEHTKPGCIDWKRYAHISMYMYACM
jgi:hypothetical protein